MLAQLGTQGARHFFASKKLQSLHMCDTGEADELKLVRRPWVGWRWPFAKILRTTRHTGDLVPSWSYVVHYYDGLIYFILLFYFCGRGRSEDR
jgi:hypothetical protein